MKTQTSVRAGGRQLNHNQTPASARDLKVQRGIKSGTGSR